MSLWTLSHHFDPQLPAYCEPENEFLLRFSALFHTCVPTNLAFVSTLLGTLSIVSWLFAQLPQIYKNFQLGSTSGLSIFFLAEWLLGDVSNLLGSLFTRQATWQVIIAMYYCFVDCMLVGQWIWYEHLKHGRPMKSVWAKWRDNSDRDDASINSDVLDGASIASSANSIRGDKSGANTPKPIPHARPQDIFHTPIFSRSPSVNDFSSANNTPTSRTINRFGTGNSPMPSPRTVLFISMLLGVLAHASPTPASPVTLQNARDEVSATEQAGKILSWLSTLLYLGSRLPQLYKNHVRRSTAGLSPTLFAAAFFGNFFYSSSLLTNPCAWNTYTSGHRNGSRGWVGDEGSNQANWVLRATPFFLGAAGVLIMDGLVGLQFWWFGSHGTIKEGREEVIVVVVPDGGRTVDTRVGGGRGKRWRWRKVSGWMRGWVPSVRAVGIPRTPRNDGAMSPAEGRGLLTGEPAREYGTR
jgi:solute carrier family 66 (lysosomal lysine-arginine transporter), member 1